MNILFTCAGRRNYLINYFKEVLHKEGGRVFATDMQLTAPALVDADQAICVPSIYDDNYINSLLEIIKTNHIHCVISLNDLELPILSEVKEQIEKLGAKLVVSDPQVIKIAFDKWETALFLKQIGIKYPRTFLDIEQVKKEIALGSLSFPLVVKPRWGSASIGIDFPENIEELELVYKLQNIRLKRTILANASQEDLDRAILIQEKIKGIEYGMDVLNDFDKNYVTTSVRKKLLMRSGETDKAVSVVDEKFEDLGKKIGQNLKHIGNLDCDVFEYQGELYVLEFNPRFGGGYPFSHEAGNNTAAIYVEWLKGNKDISKHLAYRDGILFSKCDRLLKISK
ncbi:carbamoyl phosphate synthase-like protein [Capnocytophaga canimorsus]|uniref:ATP-grasp domain-containing protein n=1 Tax=Capnocytophaga canimorsus TaxID=28188 RepID=UPI001ACBDB62|nr:ATP-grasp domain-containing protein [Capnocytophaga canimorsus]GIM56339.1 carbamoyl phosphate synthase-like protein [Capnocytophaga canimorsus]